MSTPVHVTVTTPHGTSAESENDVFTYVDDMSTPVHVTVTTPHGTSAESENDVFTYVDLDTGVNENEFRW